MHSSLLLGLTCSVLIAGGAHKGSSLTGTSLSGINSRTTITVLGDRITKAKEGGEIKARRLQVEIWNADVVPDDLTQKAAQVFASLTCKKLGFSHFTYTKAHSYHFKNTRWGSTSVGMASKGGPNTVLMAGIGRTAAKNDFRSPVSNPGHHRFEFLLLDEPGDLDKGLSIQKRNENGTTGPVQAFLDPYRVCPPEDKDKSTLTEKVVRPRRQAMETTVFMENAWKNIQDPEEVLARLNGKLSLSLDRSLEFIDEAAK